MATQQHVYSVNTSSEDLLSAGTLLGTKFTVVSKIV